MISSSTIQSFANKEKVHSFTYDNNSLLFYQSIYSFIYFTYLPFFYLFINLFIYLFICLSIYLFICLFVEKAELAQLESNGGPDNKPGIISGTISHSNGHLTHSVTSSNRTSR